MHDLAKENNYRFTPTRAYQDKPILGSIDNIYAPTKSSLDQLKNKLLRQEERGYAAEQFVLQYELKRLEGHPNINRVKIIKLDKNHGFAKGYNIGLKKIEDDILCLLNNDVEVTENWTENILKQFELEPKTAIIQPKLKNYYEKSEFDYAGASGGYLDKYGYPYCDGRNYKIIEKDLGQYDKIKDIFWACGACFFVRKKIFC